MTEPVYSGAAGGGLGGGAPHPLVPVETKTGGAAAPPDLLFSPSLDLNAPPIHPLASNSDGRGAELEARRQVNLAEIDRVLRVLASEVSRRRATWHAWHADAATERRAVLEAVGWGLDDPEAAEGGTGAINIDDLAALPWFADEAAPEGAAACPVLPWPGPPELDGARWLEEAAAELDPELKLLEGRVGALGSCLRWRVAQLHRTEDRARLTWARCRARGCPYCDGLRGAEVRDRACKVAAELGARGLELRVVTLTQRGNPDEQLPASLARMRGALRRLRESGAWATVEAAQLFFETPRNPWHHDRNRPEEERRHHWHTHAHLLVWLRPGSPGASVWAPTDERGARSDLAPYQRAELRGLLAELVRTPADTVERRALERRLTFLRYSGAARVWSGATGVPLGELRMQVQVPYSQGEAAREAAQRCAVAYASKYASKGTAAVADRHLVPWVLQSHNQRLFENYGAAREVWAATKPASEWQLLATEVELGARALRVEERRADVVRLEDALARAEGEAAELWEHLAAEEEALSDVGLSASPALHRAVQAAEAHAERLRLELREAARALEEDRNAGRLLLALWGELDDEPSGEVWGWARAHNRVETWDDIVCFWAWTARREAREWVESVRPI